MKKPRVTAATSGPDGLAPAGDVAAIVAGTHGDPFAVLGVHEAGKRPRRPLLRPACRDRHRLSR